MRKKMKKITTLLLFTVFLLSSQMSAFAAPAMMPDGTIFDAEYYAQKNPDVAAVQGTDAAALYNHYISNGRAEGRQAYNPAADISALLQSPAYAAAIDASLRATDSSYAELKAAMPGSYVTFGAYEQDNNKRNGQEPIEWLVLENNGESLLVISKHALDAQPYSTAYDTYTYKAHPVTWEQCSLRAWLNSSFYMTAFSEGERARIKTTLLNNKVNTSNFINRNVDGGKDTSDNVFLLSHDEVIQYFPMKDVWKDRDGDAIKCDKLLQITATPYAVAQGADVWTEKDAKAAITMGGAYGPIAYDVIGYVEKWALRTPYMEQTCIYNVGAAGSFGIRTVTYDHANRPAMRINIK